MTTQALTDTLNSLLRGELAATETYQQALSAVGDEPGAADLHRIHADHREAANTLRQYIRTYAGEPDHGPGAWGAFAQVVEGSAKLLGDAAALRALRRGEQSGLAAYEDALEDHGLPLEVRTYIYNTLLTRTRAHLAVLDRLLQGR